MERRELTSTEHCECRLHLTQEELETLNRAVALVSHIKTTTTGGWTRLDEYYTAAEEALGPLSTLVALVYANRIDAESRDDGDMIETGIEIRRSLRR